LKTTSSGEDGTADVTGKRRASCKRVLNKVQLQLQGRRKGALAEAAIVWALPLRSQVTGHVTADGALTVKTSLRPQPKQRYYTPRRWLLLGRFGPSPQKITLKKYFYICIKAGCFSKKIESR